MGIIRLLVADDHEMVRCGVVALLENTSIEVVCQASTGKEAEALATSQEVDVVLLDVRMPDGDGLTALGKILLERPALPVLMFSSHDNPTYVARSVAWGAKGYLLKNATKAKLIDAIKNASQGESAWSREELRRVTGALATPRMDSDVEVPLTKRESEVLRQLALGLTNKEIALALSISYETVKEHVQHILRKVGVSDRTQAAVWAVRNNLV